MLPSFLVAVPFFLAVSLFPLPDGLSVRHAVIGTVLVSLATAAASIVSTAPPSFHTANNALLWCGLLLGLIAVVGAWRARRRAASLPLALALIAVLAACSGLLREGHVTLSLLGGLLGAAALAALRVGTARVGADPGRATSGAIRRWGMPLLLALLLLPALWLTLTIAGKEGWSLQGLREAPFSPAAETLLAALLLPASLILAGTWPFGLLGRGPRFAPLGALVLLAAVVPLLGLGMAHWRSVYAGWLVLSALIAAVGARWPQLFACAGLFSIGCGGRSSWWAGALLALIASLLMIAPPANAPRRVVMLVAAGCGIVALRATLGVEVVYSAAMALATIIATLRTPLAAASGA